MMIYTPEAFSALKTPFMGRTEAISHLASWLTRTMATAGNNTGYPALLVVNNPIGFVNPPAPPSAKVLF